MLNVKKTLTKIMAWIPGFTTESFTSGSITVASYGAETSTLNATKTGWVPIGIIGISKAGAGNGSLTFTAFYISENNAIVSLYNTANASRTLTVTATVLYRRA